MNPFLASKSWLGIGVLALSWCVELVHIEKVGYLGRRRLSLKMLTCLIYGWLIQTWFVCQHR